MKKINGLDQYSVIDIDTTNVTLGGKPAFKIEYSYSNKPDYIQNMALEIGTIINGYVYTIQYYAPSNYSRYLPTIENMIHTLRLVEKLPYDSVDKKVRIDYPSDWTKKIEDNDQDNDNLIITFQTTRKSA